MHSANDIADWFLSSVDREAGDNITHLKLQKLVYYAQVWSLVLLDKPLFDEDFQAWAHGPVVPSVFDRFKGNGWEALPPPQTTCVEFNDATNDLLTAVFEAYGQHSAKHLEKLTHSESPWREARGNISPEARSSNIIPKEKIHSFYKKQYDSVNVES